MQHLLPFLELVFCSFDLSILESLFLSIFFLKGIIYINIFSNGRDVSWAPFLAQWIEAREDEKEKAVLMALFHKFTSQANMAAMRQFKRVVPLSEINQIKTLCYLLEGLCILIIFSMFHICCLCSL